MYSTTEVYVPVMPMISEWTESSLRVSALASACWMSSPSSPFLRTLLITISITTVNSRTTPQPSRYSSFLPSNNKRGHQTTTTTGCTNGELRSALGRVYLQSGQIDRPKRTLRSWRRTRTYPNRPKRSAPPLWRPHVGSGTQAAAGEVLRGLVG